MSRTTVEDIQLNTINLITQTQIKEKAVQLFNVFSQAMNDQEDSYCNNFEYLNQRHKQSWLKLAEHELKN